MAPKDCALDREGIEQQDHVRREVCNGVSLGRLVGIPVAALRHADGADLRREKIEDGLIGAPRMGWPGQQKHRRIGPVALPGVGQRQTGGEGDRRHDGNLCADRGNALFAHRLRGGPDIDSRDERHQSHGFRDLRRLRRVKVAVALKPAPP